MIDKYGLNGKWGMNGKYAKYMGGGYILLLLESLHLWPGFAYWIEMTFYSIAVVGIFLGQVLLYKRRKRFWWALGVPLVGHIFFLAKLEKLFPFRYPLLGLLLGIGELSAMYYAMVLIFGVTKKNPLVPDSYLPEAIEQNEDSATSSSGLH
jgi:hypothetical protein